MKISRSWLQTFFESTLPNSYELAEALTFHAFEIETVEGDTILDNKIVREGDLLDVKVTANRGHDCLSHRGIAVELSAILKLPLKSDPLRKDIALEPKNGAVAVAIDTPLCKRYIAGYIRNVKVGPSPNWLKSGLESIGQRSINNVVDATNFVMFNIGQPLHAFDASRLTKKDEKYSISVRMARTDEKMKALDGKEYIFTDSMMLITDAYANAPIGIAGVKGGEAAQVNEETQDIIIESANFEGTSVRKTAQTLKLRTDASSRYEQVISPEYAAFGMSEVVDLIQKVAGGEVVGFTDLYPEPQKRMYCAVTVEKVNQVLGTHVSGAEVADVFQRLGFGYKEDSGVFEVHVPPERLDLVIPEDLVEEVGRIMGYDKVAEVELPPMPAGIEINPNFYRSEAIREYLTSRGFSEVFTSVFTEKGERVVLNKADGVRPYLRSSLREGLDEALARNVRNKDLLGIPQVRIFEIGTIWTKDGEEITFDIAVEKIKKAKSEDDYRKELDEFVKTVPVLPATYEMLPVSSTERYKPFSKYPFIVRDVALWVPSGTESGSTLDLMRKESGDLLVRSAQFDRFEKEGRVSYAFRLVFQSFEKTLTDEEVQKIMEGVESALREKEYEIR